MKSSQFFVLLLIGMMFLSPTCVMANTMIVDTNADTLSNADGKCSLREAIANSNGNNQSWTNCPAGNGIDVINFNLPAGQETITMGNTVLTISQAVVIDGLTQPSASCAAPVVQIAKGGSASTAFSVTYTAAQTGNIVIKGLNIKNFTSNAVGINTFNAFGGSVTCNKFENDAKGIFLLGTNAAAPHTFVDNNFGSVTGITIDLGGDGASANDLKPPATHDDADGGANAKLNYPVVQSATLNGTTATITFLLYMPVGTGQLNYRVDFYSSGVAIGNANVTTDDVDGSTTHTVTLNGVNSLANLKATATEVLAGGLGATSEMSPVFAGSQPPHLDQFTSTTGNGKYGPNKTVDVRAVYNQTLTSGSIQVVLNSNAPPLTLTVVPNTNTAVGTYTVCAATGCGENTPAGQFLKVSSIVAGSENIVGTGGTQNGSTMPTDNFTNKQIVIDTTAPGLLSFSSTTNNGVFGPAFASINVTAVFDDDLKTGSTMTVVLNSGKTLVLDQVGTGGNSKKLSGSYTVCSSTGCGENTPAGDYLNVSSIASANVIDAADNVSSSTNLPGTNIAPTKQLVVDTTAPGPNQPQFADSSINGNVLTLIYNELLDPSELPFGTTYKMQVNNNSDVSPTSVALNAADHSKVVLTFNPANAVHAGDVVKLKYDKPAVFAIEDVAQGPAGAGNDAPSFDYTTINNITPDNEGPVLVDITSATINGSYGVNHDVNIRVLYFDPNDVAANSHLDVKLNTGDNYTFTLDQVAPHPLLAHHFYIAGTFTVLAGQNAADLDVTLLNVHVFDGQGHEQTGTSIPSGHRLQDNKDILIDTIAPVLLSFSSSNGNDVYGPGYTNIDITATFSDPSDLAPGSTMKVVLNTGKEVTLNSVSGKMLSGQYTVCALTGCGENTPAGQYLTVDSIVQGSVSVKDLANNETTSTVLPSTNIFPNKQIKIDTAVPELDMDGVFIEGKVLILQYKEELDVSQVSPTDSYSMIVNNNGNVVHPLTVEHDNVIGRLRLTFSSSVPVGASVQLKYDVPVSQPPTDPAEIEDKANGVSSGNDDGNDAPSFGYVTINNITLPAGIVVNSTSSASSNDGLCTLQEAIFNANNNTGYSNPVPGECAKGIPGNPSGSNSLDIISFHIPGFSSHTIDLPSSGWPLITQQIVIDGTSQPLTDCVAGDLRIEINGSALPGGAAAFNLATPDTAGSVIKGLAINRSPIGIKVGSDNVTVQCNNIGTDSTGTTALGNNIGISVLGKNGLIGGVYLDQKNVISGNNDAGVQLSAAAEGNTVFGNRIGTDMAGTALIPNAVAGVRVSSVLQNTIGGLDDKAANIIAGNGTGVMVQFPNNSVSILHNIIRNNAGLGIDLGPLGVTDNESSDGYQDFPEITSVYADGTNLVIEFKLDPSPATSVFRVEAFANPNGSDSSGHGEGEMFVGFSDVAAVSGQTLSMVLPNSSQYVTSNISLTATEKISLGFGATSEFSLVLSRLDYGDAPDFAPGTSQNNYNTKASDNGASNALSEYYLGNCVDEDSGELNGVDAKADDQDVGAHHEGTCLSAGDDEDGISFFFMPSIGKWSSLKARASKEGYLNGWVDYNDDGDWLDSNEHFISDKLLAPGQQFVNFFIPANVSAGKKYFRFRFTRVPGGDPVGLGGEGEVEDYRITIGNIIVICPDCQTELEEGGGSGENLQKWNPLTGNDVSANPVEGGTKESAK